MKSTQRLLHVVPHSVPFVDHSGIAWDKVRRSHYWLYQCFRYEYPGPIRNLHQRMMVVPPYRHGDQLLSGHKLRVSAAQIEVDAKQDDFGNQVYYLDLPEVHQSVNFEVWSSVERYGGPPKYAKVSSAEAGHYREPTALTRPEPALQAIAQELATERHPWDLADRINEWVWDNMSYAHGITNVATTAAQALELGRGLCQDYSHIMITLCRLLGLPARYVSGHLLGEGGSHAWVEVLLPAPKPSRGKDLVAVAFDPTNHCRAGLRHITVAVGRDYRDVSPTSGHYSAPYQGQLITSKRAGLITVEYFDGSLTSVDDNQLIFLDDTKRIA